MAACSPDQLLADSACFADISQPQQRAVMIQLLRAWSGNTQTVNELMADAACYAGMERKQQKTAIIGLLLGISGC